MIGSSPSAELRAILEGRSRLEDADHAVRSWARLPIHQVAAEITELATLERRRAAIERLPETIRPHVKEEILRIWHIND